MEDSITKMLESNISTDKFTLSVESSKELNYTPNQASVALATAVTIAGAALYLALRFRPSRGISALVVSAGSTAIAYGLFVAMRVGTSAVTSLAMPVVAISTLIASLFYFATEKAMLKEKHGADISADIARIKKYDSFLAKLICIQNRGTKLVNKFQIQKMLEII